MLNICYTQRYTVRLETFAGTNFRETGVSEIFAVGESVTRGLASGTTKS